MPQRHVTLAEIARRAGVTAATVSIALRGRPNVAAATREKIAAIARELNYRPNPYVSALMRIRRSSRHRSDRPVLALVNGLRHPGAWRNALSLTRRQVYEGAWERVRELGYVAQEFWLHRDSMTAERFSRMLHARGISGIILGPLHDGVAAPALCWELFSAVSLSVPQPALPLPTVCSDHYLSSARAALECYARGYRRLGLVMREGHRALFQGRVEAGFFAAQRECAGMVALAPLYTGRFEDERPETRLQFRKWLRRERPEAILTLDAPAVERLIGLAGLTAPKDVGLAALSTPAPGHRLSGVYQNGRLVGATAVNVLVGMVERAEKGLLPQPITTMVEGAWNAGETLPALVNY